MIKRLLPSIIALGIALILMAVLFVALLGMFGRELADTEAAIKDRRIALEQYAHASIIQRLDQQLAASIDHAVRAENDPLAPDNGVFLEREGQRILPRPITYVTDDKTPAKDLYMTLAEPAGDTKGQGPWGRRLELRRGLIRAVKSGRKGAIEQSFRAVLAHRARYVIPVTQDLPFMLATVDWFAAAANPDPKLIRMLMHSGVPDRMGRRLEGLQRQLLRRRSAFTAKDFDFLQHRVAQTSSQAEAPIDDFKARVQDKAAKITLPKTVKEPALIETGNWYVAPNGDTVRGVHIELTELLATTLGEMRARSLLTDADDLVLPEFQAIHVRTMALTVKSDSWTTAAEAAQSRYRSKTALLMVAAIFAILIVLLAVFVQFQKQRYLEMKSDFVATVSHELRTPLAGIRAMAETLARRLDGDERARDYPTRIVRDVDGLAFLVENILSFNRLDKGRWVARTTQIVLGDVFTFVREEMSRYETRPVEWSIRGDATATLQADADLLKLLYLNLARNAAQYNKRDPISLRLTIDTKPNQIIVRFRDNGVGISGKTRKRVFEEFFRGADSPKTHGSGLGLSICERIMGLHKGKIKLDDTGPDGTTFVITHPRNQGKAQPPKPTPKEQPPSEAQMQRAQKKRGHHEVEPIELPEDF